MLTRVLNVRVCMSGFCCICSADDHVQRCCNIAVQCMDMYLLVDLQHLAGKFNSSSYIRLLGSTDNCLLMVGSCLLRSIVVLIWYCYWPAAHAAGICLEQLRTVVVMCAFSSVHLSMIIVISHLQPLWPQCLRAWWWDRAGLPSAVLH